MAQDTATSVPFLNAYGNITKVLEKIKSASTPSRFTQDFLGTKLGLPSGSAKPLIPFLKRTGFLNSDGTPSELYKQFRNDAMRGAAAARALKSGYAGLYEINEYAHELKDNELKGVIVQTTGFDSDSSSVKAILGSFKALKAFAKFDGDWSDGTPPVEEREEITDVPSKPKGTGEPTVGLRLGYTINLNLPATSDIAVFNAIFKSLREHLLD